MMSTQPRRRNCWRGCRSRTRRSHLSRPQETWRGGSLGLGSSWWWLVRAGLLQHKHHVAEANDRAVAPEDRARREVDQSLGVLAGHGAQVQQDVAAFPVNLPDLASVEVSVRRDLVGTGPAWILLMMASTESREPTGMRLADVLAGSGRAMRSACSAASSNLAENPGASSCLRRTHSRLRMVDLNATASASTRAGQIKTRTKARMVSITDMPGHGTLSRVRGCFATLWRGPDAPSIFPSWCLFIALVAAPFADTSRKSPRAWQ